VKRSRILWSTAQILAVVAMYPLFFALMPWFGSDPIGDVPAQIAAEMPRGCPAVFSSHGHYSCFWPGLLRDHPVKVALLMAALLACWAFLIYSARIWRSAPAAGSKTSP
jgi:hypothetical protein